LFIVTERLFMTCSLVVYSVIFNKHEFAIAGI